MDAHQRRVESAKAGYGNLGSDEGGLQKVANDMAKKAVLKDFAAELDNHDLKRLPTTGSPLRSLPMDAKAPVQEEKAVPLDFDERMQKYLRD